MWPFAPPARPALPPVAQPRPESVARAAVAQSSPAHSTPQASGRPSCATCGGGWAAAQCRAPASRVCWPRAGGWARCPPTRQGARARGGPFESLAAAPRDSPSLPRPACLPRCLAAQARPPALPAGLWPSARAASRSACTCSAGGRWRTSASGAASCGWHCRQGRPWCLCGRSAR